ncbi:MAG: thioredoxin family protein [Ruminococcus sp.]
MAARVNQENFQQEVLEAKGLVLADFYSDSCIPCKRLSPVLSELEEADWRCIESGKSQCQL